MPERMGGIRYSYPLFCHLPTQVYRKSEQPNTRNKPQIYEIGHGIHTTQIEPKPVSCRPACLTAHIHQPHPSTCLHAHSPTTPIHLLTRTFTNRTHPPAYTHFHQPTNHPPPHVGRRGGHPPISARGGGAQRRPRQQPRAPFLARAAGPRPALQPAPGLRAPDRDHALVASRPRRLRGQFGRAQTGRSPTRPPNT